MSALEGTFAEVVTETGLRFQARVANLATTGLFLRSSVPLHFRQRLTLRLFGVSVRGEVLFLSDAPQGAVIGLRTNPSALAMLEAHRESVEVIEPGVDRPLENSHPPADPGPARRVRSEVHVNGTGEAMRPAFSAATTLSSTSSTESRFLADAQPRLEIPDEDNADAYSPIPLIEEVPIDEPIEAPPSISSLCPSEPGDISIDPALVAAAAIDDSTGASRDETADDTTTDAEIPVFETPEPDAGHGPRFRRVGGAVRDSYIDGRFTNPGRRWPARCAFCQRRTIRITLRIISSTDV